MNEARFAPVKRWLMEKSTRDSFSVRATLKALIIETLLRDCPQYPDRALKGIAEDFFDHEISFMTDPHSEFDQLRREWFRSYCVCQACTRT